MKLSTVDRRFVRALAREHAERTLAVLEQRSEYLTSMTGGRRGRSLGRDVKDLGHVAMKAMLGSLSGARVDADGAFYERASASVDVRTRYLSAHRPGASFAAVTSGSVYPRMPLLRVISVLVPTFVAVITADRRSRSVMADAYVDIAAACIRVLGTTAASHERLAYLFRAYRQEVPIVAGCLMANGCTAAVVVGTSALGYNMRTMQADVAVLATPYQAEEFEFYRPLGDRGDAVLWGPESVIDIPAAAWKPSGTMPTSVGAYTQGYWLRRELGTIGSCEAEPFIELETRFVELLMHYAHAHPDVQVVVYRHPMERRHAQEGGSLGYEGLLSLPNVLLAEDRGWDSLSSLDEVGLGLTTASNVGFDRLHLGRRTLFFVGEDTVAFPRLESTAYNRVLIRDPFAFLETIEAARLQGDHEFFEAYGLPKSDGPTHLAEQPKGSAA